MALAVCMLAGCGRTKPDGEGVRAHFSGIEGFEAHVKMTADLGESVQEYEVDYVYSRQDNDLFTITAPESLAGISGAIAGTESARFSLQYDNMQLDDAMPQRVGLTPADGLYCLLADLRGAEPAQQWTESVSGQSLLVLRYESEDDTGGIERQVWLTADGCRPVCAEIYADGQCVLTLQMTEYKET